MTVTVTLPDGSAANYMRFGDCYIKHNDGTLDIVRTGNKQHHSYASGEWADVDGDQKKFRKRPFWG